MIWLMLALLAAGLGVFGAQMNRKLGALAAAAPATPFDRWADRIDRVVVYMIGQKRLFKEPKSGIMHALIFWGFCVVSIRTITLFAMAFAPSGFDFHLPGFGEGWLGSFYAPPFEGSSSAPIA